MVVLVPPFLIFDRARKSLRLSLVQVSCVLVAVPGTLLYLALMLADIAVASIVFLLIGKVSAILRRPASAAR